MSDGLDFTAEYLKALSLPKSEEVAIDRVARTAALARAHGLRKFEIENYWKRATYFWAFQLAAFTLFGLLWQKVAETKLDRNALLLPAGLGAITAQVGWLTARGSKFWQENWEGHVDMLEQVDEGRLTQVIISKRGQQYSVSRANEALVFLLLCGWVTCFAVIEWSPLQALFDKMAIWLPAAGLLFLIVGVAAFSRMNLSGWAFMSGAGDWEAVEKPRFSQWIDKGLERLKLAPPTQIMLRDSTEGKAAKPEVGPTANSEPVAR